MAHDEQSESHEPHEHTISGALAECIRYARRIRGWTAAELATRCQQLGADHITHTIIANIEQQRRTLSVHMLTVIAAALDVPPLDLLVTSDSSSPIRITSQVSVSPERFAAWWRGEAGLPGTGAPIEAPPLSTATGPFAARLRWAHHYTNADPKQLADLIAEFMVALEALAASNPAAAEAARQLHSRLESADGSQPPPNV